MNLISFKQFLIISRPIIFPLLLVCFLVALFFSAPTKSSISNVHLFFIFLLTFLLPFFTFSINDLEDVSSDRINKRKKHILFGKYIPNLNNFSSSIFFYNFLIFFVLILFSFFFLSFTTSFLLLFLLILIFFYSKKPIRLKEVIFLDSLSNGLIALLSFSVIYTFFNPLQSLPLAIYFIALSISSYHLIAAYLDMKSDKKASHNSTAVFLSNKHLIFLLALLYNIPLFFISFSSFFKYLFFINLFVLGLVYFFPNTNKIYLFLIFIFCWLFITINYIWNFLF